MTIQPVQDSSNRTSVHSLETSSPIPSGLSGVPDRLESSSQREVQHPSQFKKFLFDPIASLIKWAFRPIFQFFNRLRGISSDDRRPEWRLVKERI